MEMSSMQFVEGIIDPPLLFLICCLEHKNDTFQFICYTYMKK